MENTPGFAFSCASHSLADLLAQARQALAEQADEHTTQRGPTRSVNKVLLTWQAPHTLDEPGLKWTLEEAQWYLRTFVERRAENDPLTPAAPGKLLFAYTYAARSRFWDAGWAQLFLLVQAMRQEEITLASMYADKRSFQDALARLGEQLHLQTVLSLLALYPLAILAHYIEHPELALETAHAWRCDTLASAIADLASNPHSRRAVVSSLCYPHLEDKLNPQMGKPPYQLFQLLPGEADAPLSSIHEHRSLDVGGGAQLDFLHDLAWLTKASQMLQRPIGDISIITHNLHEYHNLLQVHEDIQAHSDSEIEQWLCSVTDGYQAGRGVPRLLLKQPGYAANAERISRLHAARDI